MKIEMVSIYELQPAEYNPRVMPPEEMERLKNIIRDTGLVQPIVVNLRTGNITGGHQRVEACRALGHEQVPVVYVDLDEQKEKALNLALNKISGDWDRDKLMELIYEIGNVDIETGFDENEVAELLAQFEAKNTPPRGDEDEPAPLEREIVSREGEVYVLGRHRLVVGDALSPDTLDALMAGTLADMVFTDPPYNVDYKAKAGSIRNDKMTPAEFAQFLTDAFATLSLFVNNGGALYVAHSDTERVRFQQAIESSGFKVASCLIWVKNQLVMGRSDYHWRHEPILYGWKQGGAHHWEGDRKQSTVFELLGQDLCDQVDEKTAHIFIGDRTIEIRGDNLEAREMLGTLAYINKPSKNTDHPTMKPVALVEKYIGNSSRPAQIVLDPFGGSGSTLIACEKTARTARLVELDPQYADAIVRRWQNYTGLQAVRSDGVKFDDIRPRMMAV